MTCTKCQNIMLRLGNVGGADFYACNRCSIEVVVTIRDCGTYAQEKETEDQRRVDYAGCASRR